MHAGTSLELGERQTAMGLGLVGCCMSSPHRRPRNGTVEESCYPVHMYSLYSTAARTPRRQGCCPSQSGVEGGGAAINHSSAGQDDTFTGDEQKGICTVL